MASLLESALNRLLIPLVASEEGKVTLRNIISRLLWLCRWATRLCAFSYVAGLFILWLACRYIGEENITLTFALYLPPTGWALPLAVIVPLALVFDWKSLIPAAAGAAIVALGFCGWQSHSPQTSAPNESALTVLTFNRGESSGSLQPFKNLTKPDVLIFQEAANRADRYANSPGYEEMIYGENIGEFSLVSRFPITSKELISNGKTVMAARFTIEWNKQSVVLYSMHLPSPRHSLQALERGAFLWGVLGQFGKWANKRKSYEDWWHSQISLAETMLSRAEAETLPCIVAGDSNAPAPGYIHHLLTRRLTDSHEAAGSGCGLSFPGTTRNPLSLG
ncbi:MAG: Metal-dependent hydrolase, partial [Verrucomicrobiaceae bacterium]|nr:Metal-dependent hydrolase [Verrucomicrobiaceae bacterium]